MCGIAGAFSYRDSGRVDRGVLVAVRDQMERRGPDAAGLWVSGDERVGLAHRRLSIIDLSDAGTQPMVCGDGRYVIVFNGEIYNYRELRERVMARGYELRSHCDTEVLPYLYEMEGMEMFRLMRGMYAFGLWDTREQELLLARDPLGIKPLYFADDGKQFWFASQVKALLAGGVGGEADPAGHVGYHLWGNVPEPFTLFKNIRALPAGHYLKLGRGGEAKVREYWSLRGVLEQAAQGRGVCSVAARSASTGSAARESLRALLADSLRDHLVADVPVGVFLSSGRDSATLAALASENKTHNLHALTMGFEEFRGTEKDEMPLARVVAEQFGATHDEVIYSRLDMQKLMDPFLAAMDQPTVDGFNVFMVSHAAAVRGLKVALSGVGADEAFQGYTSFQTIPQLARRMRVFGMVPGLGTALRVVSAPFVKARTNPKYASLVELGGKLGGAYLLRRGMYMPWELPSILDGEMVREGLRKLQPLAELNEVGGTPGMDDGVRLVVLEFQYYLRNQLLRDTDWASMAHSLEVRTPFVDARLLEGIVKHANQFGWPSKGLMAATPRTGLPEELLNKPKTGFGIPSFNPRRDKPVKGELPQRTWAREVYLNYLLPAANVTPNATPNFLSGRSDAKTSAAAVCVS